MYFVFRSFKKKDLPEGFPEEFREHALFGQQEGRLGRPSFFYSQACTSPIGIVSGTSILKEMMEEQLRVKVICQEEASIRAKRQESKTTF